MEDRVTNEELKAALRESDRTVELFLNEMGVRFGEVNPRLDQTDASLVEHCKQIGAGARAIAGFNAWVGKADADYTRLLAELSEVKRAWTSWRIQQRRKKKDKSARSAQPIREL